MSGNTVRPHQVDLRLRIDRAGMHAPKGTPDVILGQVDAAVDQAMTEPATAALPWLAVQGA